MARDLTGHREYDKISTLILPGNELHELISLMKEIDDRCQMNGVTEPWTSYDERLQERLKELKERNMCREQQINQMKLERLSKLSVDDLVTLELELEAALQVLRDSKGVYDHGIPHVFASAGLQPNQLNLVEETKSVLTSCSVSNCSINQPDLGYETESNITSSYNSN